MYLRGNRRWVALHRADHGNESWGFSFAGAGKFENLENLNLFGIHWYTWH